MVQLPQWRGGEHRAGGDDEAGGHEEDDGARADRLGERAGEDGPEHGGAVLDAVGGPIGAL